MIKFLICPRDNTRLTMAGDTLTCEAGHSYPLVDDIPVLIIDDLADNQPIRESLALAKHPTPDIYRGEAIHPQVQAIVASTNGRLYSGLVGRLPRYPIPEIRLPDARGKTLLDVGCNWGRWCVAAARKGYRVTGIDPNLHSLRAARIMCKQLNVEVDFICGDARRMPILSGSFDAVFSYSVVQHFAKPTARIILQEIARIIKANGTSLIQMPNRHGIRSQYHLARRRYSEGQLFDVRYWSPSELLSTFTEIIGPSCLSVDGFFGLGIQPSDADLMPFRSKAIIRLSELLRRSGLLSGYADSLYVHSARTQPKALKGPLVSSCQSTAAAENL